MIVQLSDLHLFASPEEQEGILSSLIGALEEERRRHDRVDLLVVTGDLFDSATLPTEPTVERFLALHLDVQRALGGAVPTVVVPGNHDRRAAGLVGPHRQELFDALAERARETAWIHGTGTPFLAEVLPPSFHGLPLFVVAFDSTYLPRGLLGAGGAVREEDLLRAAAIIGDREPDWPVLVLLHHHLVPTPLTDLGPVVVEGAGRIARWSVERLLPELVANGDREELTMTALGAGTALSTLHAMGRAVLVLHGHKHYPTARCLDATLRGQGDVLVVGAGSAGTAQSLGSTRAHDDEARLWPSFNVIRLAPDGLEVETVSFSWKRPGRTSLRRMQLVSAKRAGSQWRAQPVSPAGIEPGEKRVATNEAICRLERSTRWGETRWDGLWERHVTASDGESPRRYPEIVGGEPEARLVRGLAATGDGQPLPMRLDLPLDRIFRYRVEGAAMRVQGATEAARGDAPYGSVALMNRYRADVARLVARGLGEKLRDAFASTTDLQTGLQSPLRVERDPERDEARVEVRDCPPRTLLRIFWPLTVIRG